MKELRQIIELIEQIDVKMDNLMADNKEKSETIEKLQSQYKELDETYNRMHKIKLKKENELYEQITDLQDKIKQMEIDSMDAITFDVYEKDIKARDKEIEDLKKSIQNRDRLIRELKEDLSKHELNKDIHKRPLDNTARLHSQQTRQNNAEQDKLKILETISSYIHHYYSKDIIAHDNQQITDQQLRQILKVDMAKIISITKKSDKTIRETVSSYASGNIKVSFTTKYLNTWLKINQNGQLFKNT